MSLCYRLVAHPRTYCRMKSSAVILLAAVALLATVRADDLDGALELGGSCSGGRWKGKGWRTRHMIMLYPQHVVPITDCGTLGIRKRWINS